MNVSMVVNNLGGTSCLELYIIANSAIRYLGTYNHFKKFNFEIILLLLQLIG